MTEYVDVGGVGVATQLYRFLVEEALPGSGTSAERLWQGLVGLVDRFAPRNQALLAERARLQGQIDDWHRHHPFDMGRYRDFLESIGYLLAPGPPFTISTRDVDPEISTVAGPQLVVPVMNARYALNAANARWGSLYDSLYGTDALGTGPPGGPYDPKRGAEVIGWARAFLDEVVPLREGSHRAVRAYSVHSGQLAAAVSGRTVGLAHPQAFVGHRGEASRPTSIVLRHNGLHIELVIDRTDRVGRDDLAGVADVLLESALTSIMDCEDSVVAVDASDKALVYRNWLGLMKGDLTAEVVKGGRSGLRRLADDRTIVSPDGRPATLRGRALMLVRTVGLHMTTPAARCGDGSEFPEGLMDALITVLAAKHDVLRGSGSLNSKAGSVYVVTPKLHGPLEASFVDDVYSFVEDVLDLPRHTVKLGLMDEERRTTLNLAECVRAISARVVFINTGFLDRTGDEIHTSMQAGPVVRKNAMRTTAWLQAYEDNNVHVGLACGFPGVAQIGKGMWAAPDLMADMLRDKVAHPLAGASCAWVPSPTAATLHATHYHRVDVRRTQGEIAGSVDRRLEELLSIPIGRPGDWSRQEIREELENNAQGILGYVVRWVDQGIGCSKVPDIHDVQLMEDRATCRISSQHIANWLRHGVVTGDEVVSAMKKMAVVVDRQNAHDPSYRPMGPGFDGPAFRAARDLVLHGAEHPSGYTEVVLHVSRRERKAD
ncbi:MAG: malate synthase G [Acidimicrobiales bacterium]